MKKFLAVTAAAALIIAAAGCSQGGEEAQTTEQATAAAESDLAYIKDNGVMKIGYTIINPLNYTDDSGELVGFETEFATAVCEKLGVTPEFHEIDWDSKEMELNAGSIYCVWNGLTITPEREETMSISTPYLENRQVLVMKAENEAAYTESVDGLNVVAEAGSAGNDLVTSDEFFANATYTEVQSQATALIEVESGTADVAVIDYVMAASSTGEGTDFADLVFVDKGYDSEQYGVAFRQGSDVTAEVNAAITELVSDGTLAGIAEKYGLSDLLIAE